MTGQSWKDKHKYDNFFKGTHMKYKHFDEIEPNHNTNFTMLYFAACRSLRELQVAIRKTNGGKLTFRQAWLLRRIQRKLAQMAALWKNATWYLVSRFDLPKHCILVN